MAKSNFLVSKNLENFFIRNINKNFTFDNFKSIKLKTLLLSNSVFDIKDLMTNLENIEIDTLVISYSQIYFKSNNLNHIKIPSSIKTVICKNSIVKNNFYCTKLESDQKVLNYNTPHFISYGYDENFYSLETSIYEMDKKEFIQYCNSNRDKIFNEYIKLYLDLEKLHFFENDSVEKKKYSKFMSLLSKFSFKISSTIFKTKGEFFLVLNKSNDETKILFQNQERSVRHLRNLMETNDTSDHSFSHFLHHLKK